MNILDQLNDQQKEAALHLEGPAMVLAGAGSGKTRVLTTRVAWLIEEQKVPADAIMLVTFTNKAAQEMTTRVAQQTGQRLPFAGTFHRLAATLLRRDGGRIGLNPGFSIYDSDDQMSLLKQLYKDHGFDPKEFNPKAVKAAISEAKNELVTWQEFEQTASSRFQKATADLYRIYQKNLLQQQAVDFDDLLVYSVKLLKENRDVLAHYQQDIQHVMVDEYQDTNKAQYQLTVLFTKPQNNVFVVGDFAQSIYAWRGADYHNMLELKEDFPGMKEYRLEQNYRSTQTILDAATQVISQTNAHPVLELWTTNPAADKITLYEVATGDLEADTVTREIRKLLDSYDHQDIAILYRTNAQSRPFEEAFVRQGIPYRLVGGFKFYERKEIKDLLAYLRLVANPNDTVSRNRLLKISKRKVALFDTWLIEHPAAATMKPGDILLEVIRLTAFLSQFDEKDPDDVSRIENVQELVNVAAQFEETAVFLENVALVQDDVMADTDSVQHPRAITLMSLHSAKGLEFPVVFMVGMEESLLPHSRSLLDSEQMEEERRLCYVGITRAKQKLYFSYARKRWVYGSSQYALRSRFLADIDTKLMTIHQLAPQSESYASPQNDWKRRWNDDPKPKKPAHSANTSRRVVLDDDSLDAVLKGEIDVATFLRD